MISEDSTALTSLYGAIYGLGELGPEAVRTFILPKIKELGRRLEISSESAHQSPADKTCVIKIGVLICVR